MSTKDKSKSLFSKIPRYHKLTRIVILLVVLISLSITFYFLSRKKSLSEAQKPKITNQSKLDDIHVAEEPIPVAEEEDFRGTTQEEEFASSGPSTDLAQKGNPNTTPFSEIKTDSSSENAPGSEDSSKIPGIPNSSGNGQQVNSKIYSTYSTKLLDDLDIPLTYSDDQNIENENTSVYHGPIIDSSDSEPEIESDDIGSDSDADDDSKTTKYRPLMVEPCNRDPGEVDWLEKPDNMDAGAGEDNSGNKDKGNKKNGPISKVRSSSKTSNKLKGLVRSKGGIFLLDDVIGEEEEEDKPEGE